MEQKPVKSRIEVGASAKTITIQNSSAMNSNEATYTLERKLHYSSSKLLTYFKALIKVGVCANSFFSIKNTKSSELEFQHSATKHALQMDMIYYHISLK